MQYTISRITGKQHNNNLHYTTIFKNKLPVFEAIGISKDESRLNAVKLAMLLAIQETEKMMNGKIQ